MTIVEIELLLKLAHLLIDLGLLIVMWRMISRVVFELEWNTAVMRQLGAAEPLAEPKNTKSR
jgi:hypothetical protein